MKIDRAIELLTTASQGWPSSDVVDPPIEDYFKALEMGIGALKRVKLEYDPGHQMMRHRLTEETSE